MGKATLVEAWGFVQREALNGLVTFAHVHDRAALLGINSRHLMKLRELGFLEVENRSRGGGRVMYRIHPSPPAELWLRAYDQRKKR
jgi:hypothetical protein